MADSKRLDLMQAVETALGVASVTMNSEATTKPSGLKVYREPVRQVNEADAPLALIVYGGEDLDDALTAATDESERAVSVDVTVAARATDTQRADEALDPLMVWVEIAVMSDPTLGGAAAYTRLRRVERLRYREEASLFAAATLTFESILLTKLGDPRQAP